MSSTTAMLVEDIDDLIGNDSDDPSYGDDQDNQPNPEDSEDSWGDDE